MQKFNYTHETQVQQPENVLSPSLNPIQQKKKKKKEKLQFLTDLNTEIEHTNSSL
jgi:hypothetical protein